MEIQFRWDAGEGEVFTESFAESLVGQTPEITMREFDGGPLVADLGRMTVVAAELIEDGRAVMVTCQLRGPAELPAPDLGTLSPMAFRPFKA